MIKYSVIIPTYNIEEKFFVECLESCKRQDYNNVEFIIVDDCSTYSYIQCYAVEYMREDKRFIYMKHEENKGVAAARETGIFLGHGEWILFLDADDYLNDDYLECIDKQLMDDIDLLILGFREFNDTYEKIVQVDKTIYLNKKNFIDMQMEILTGKTGEPGYSIDKVNPSSLWGKVYRKDILININHPIGVKKEQDGILSFEIYNSINKGKIISYAGYHYRINPQGCCRRYNQDIDNILLNTLNEYYKAVTRLKGSSEEYLQALYQKTVAIIGDICLLKYIHKDNISANRKNVQEFTSTINQELVQKAIHNIKCGQLTCKFKIKVFLIKKRFIKTYMLLFKISRFFNNRLHF